MKYPRIANTLFAASLAIVSLVAFAEASDTGTTDDPELQWTKADSNRDGFLTKDEMVPFPNLVHHFDKIDSNADMKISEAEYRAWMDGDQGRQ